MAKEGQLVLGLMFKRKSMGTLLREEERSRQRFLQNATFYSFNELQAMIRKSGLTIIDLYSTIFQEATEKPLHLETSGKGCHEKAGFIAIKAGKKLHSVGI